jgi:hypothetical protein
MPHSSVVHLFPFRVGSVDWRWLRQETVIGSEPRAHFGLRSARIERVGRPVGVIPKRPKRSERVLTALKHCDSP